MRGEFDLAQALSARPLRLQYRETDFDFLQRIVAAEGLNWRFEYQQADATDHASTVHAQHTLVKSTRTR
ncbi:hypothetical protein GCM10008020_23150 [Massilia psychrophila]|nr:hypothetical protein GCM10008020_23150 [Massilia psychrophila]